MFPQVSWQPWHSLGVLQLRWSLHSSLPDGPQQESHPAGPHPMGQGCVPSDQAPEDVDEDEPLSPLVSHLTTCMILCLVAAHSGILKAQLRARTLPAQHGRDPGLISSPR